MAIDKAVDSAVLDAGLKAIADAIREKGGTEDSLAFPDAMAEAIAAIEAGGIVTYGSIVPTSDVSEITIEHGLGCTPQMFFVFISPSWGSGNVFGISAFIDKDSVFNGCLGMDSYGGTYETAKWYVLTSTQFFSNTTPIYTYDETSITVNTGSSSHVFVSNKKYAWFAIGGM